MNLFGDLTWASYLDALVALLLRVLDLILLPGPAQVGAVILLLILAATWGSALGCKDPLFNGDPEESQDQVRSLGGGPI